jgi:hypothetical protein
VLVCVSCQDHLSWLRVLRFSRQCTACVISLRIEHDQARLRVLRKRSA